MVVPVGHGALCLWQNKKLAILLWPSKKRFLGILSVCDIQNLNLHFKETPFLGLRFKNPTPTPTQLLFGAELGCISCARVLESKMWLRSTTEIPGASTEGALPVSAIGAGMGEGTGQLSLKSSVRWEKRLQRRTWTRHPLWPSPPGAPGAELGRDLRRRLVLHPPTCNLSLPSPPTSLPSRASILLENCPGIQCGSDLALGKTQRFQDIMPSEELASRNGWTQGLVTTSPHPVSQCNLLPNHPVNEIFLFSTFQALKNHPTFYN